MGVRIRNIADVRRRLHKLVDTLGEGPIFVAKNKRVTAVLMDVSDYHSILGELEDLSNLLQKMVDHDCCSNDNQTVTSILALDYNEVGD